MKIGFKTYNLTTEDLASYHNISHYPIITFLILSIKSVILSLYENKNKKSTKMI